MEPLLRLARPEDDVRIGELLVEAFVTTYAKRMPEVVVSEARKTRLRGVVNERAQGAQWVLEWEGSVVGTAMLYRPSTPESEAWIPNAADLRFVAVDPKFQGRGWASKLVETALQEARDWGCGH